MDATIAQEAREIMKYGENRDGYWASEKFQKHVGKAVAIASWLYPPHENTVLFLFDNAPTHKKMPEDALNASAMNVGSGGKQPIMHTTSFVHPSSGEVVMQPMVNSKGEAKGLKTVLSERGVNVQGMVRKDVVAVLESHNDFKNDPYILEKYINSKGHIMKFLPKFHVEFSAIEPVWGYAKAKCSGKVHNYWPQEEHQACVSLQLMRKYFRKCREYMRAYREGHSVGKAVEFARKVYKRHRDTPISYEQ